MTRVRDGHAYRSPIQYHPVVRFLQGVGRRGGLEVGVRDVEAEQHLTASASSSVSMRAFVSVIAGPFR
jgi:hypothetical protein